MKKAAAIFAILMGAMMFGTWGVLFLLNQYPQVRTYPLETGYLLVAESLTAATLMTAGFGLLTHRQWATPLLLLALGELIYCTIRFAGELGQAGSVPGLAFFTAVGTAGLIFAGYLIVSAARRRLPG